MAALTLIWAAGPGSSTAMAAAPVCDDVHYTVESGQDLFLPVNGPCTDPDGDPLTAQLESGPSNGSIGPGPDGGGTYRSFPGYTGPDSLTYRAFDGAEVSNVATATIEVTPSTAEPQPPECFDSQLQEYNGQGVNLFVPCFDPDTPQDQLTFTVVDPPQHGTVPGTFGMFENARYESDPGFSGTDSFTYRASDGSLESNLATVTINVQTVPEGNLPPTCPESHAYVPAGGSIVLKANCVDPDDDFITYNLAPPSVTGGTLSEFTSTSVRYTPSPGTVSDVLGYSAKDQFHTPVIFSVEITVTDPGESTFETAPDATAAEPFAASIESPVPGPVYIDARAVTEVAPTGFFFADQEFDIVAPDAVDPANPLRFVFKLDASALAELGVGPEEIAVFRNGDQVADCAVPGSGRAEPTPCIDGREIQGDGDLWITALTMQASIWNFGADDTPPPSLPESKDDCKKDGWKAFEGFRNQGDCVSFAASGGKNGPSA